MPALKNEVIVAASAEGNERGEADGLCGYGWTGLKTQKPDWIPGEYANILVQFGIGIDPKRDKLEAPTIWSFIKGD